MVTFLIAGTVKGVVGLGLPTISLALLTVAIDLLSAMVLLIVPSLVTNLWQAMVGGQFQVILNRIWPFALMAALTIWFGVSLIDPSNAQWLSLLLGLLVMIYAVVGLTGLRLVISKSRNRWLGPVLGGVNGVVTGLTGSFVVPGVVYLQALGFSKEQLIQAMGILFFVSTVMLGLALGKNGFLFYSLR